MKKEVLLFLGISLAVISSAAFGQWVSTDVEPNNKFPKPSGQDTMRQGEYAMLLVKGIRVKDRIAFSLQSQLPRAYSEDDCIRVLESFGVSPLRGWDRDAILTKSDYTAIMYKLTGKEKLVHKVAQEICDEGAEKQVQGACPYGRPYKVKGKGAAQHFVKHQHLIKTPLRFWLFNLQPKPSKKK